MQENEEEKNATLSSHISSLMKSREEYRTLHDKLVLANRLFEEREERDGRRMKDMSSEMDSLRKQLEDARNAIITQQQMRGSFERDVHSLSRAAASLEEREKEMNLRAQDFRTQHNTLQEENGRLQKQNQQLLVDKRSLEEKVGVLQESRTTALECLRVAEKCAQERKDAEGLQRDNEALREELAGMDEDRSVAADRIMLLENNKASLLMQLGNLKIANRKELGLRDALVRRVSEAESQLNNKIEESERYRVLFEKEHAEVEKYRYALEQTTRQLNESEKEISEFHSILLEEVGDEGESNVVDDSNARTPNPISVIKLNHSNGSGSSMGSTGGGTTAVSPPSFLGTTALTEDFGYAK